jgi:cellulose synthase/poly-beta-1,6-N-acetylglucosamine synthase-like glycosyltransferase
MKQMKIYAKVAMSAECLMSVSVIVPAYNEAERISRTILSIRDQSDPPEKIIVVDDGSTDETGLVAARLGITVLRPSQRCGSKAAAQNYALPFVETKYVVAVDADTQLHPYALETMVHVMENEKRAVAACSWVQTQKQNTLWNKARTLEYLFAFVWFKRIQDFLHRPMICSGAFNITRTSTLKWLGGWPTDTLAEDMNLTWTIYTKKLGYTRFVPGAVAYTDDPDTFAKMRRQLNRWTCAYFENLRKHYRQILRNDKRFAALLTLHVVDGFLGALFWPLVIVMAYIWALWYWPFLAVAWDTLVIGCVTAIGAKRFHMIRTVISALPGYWVLRTLGTYYYLKWMLLAGVMGRTVKAGYEKGH